MPKLIKRLSFRTKLTIVLIALSLCMTAYIGMSFYSIASTNVYDTSARLSENNIAAVQVNLSDYLQSAQNLLTQVVRLPELQRILSAEELTEEGHNSFSPALMSAIRNLFYTGGSSGGTTLSFVNIYCKNGFVFSSAPETLTPYSDYDSCRNYFERLGFIPLSGYTPAKWCEHIVVKDELGRSKDCIVGTRMLYAGGTMEEIGIIVFAINENDLHRIYSGFSSDAVIMNKKGQLLSGSKKSLLGSEMADTQLMEWILGSTAFMDTMSYEVNGRAQMVSFQRLPGDLYFIIPFNYYSQMRSDTFSSVIQPMIIVAALGAALAVIFALLLSRGLSSSILSLKDVVQKVYDGDLDARYKSNSTDEIAYLGDKFNDMLEHISGLFEIQELDAKAKRNLEMRLMQSQINPHLLYNTLDSVLWFVKNGDVEKAEVIIESLSDFFRMALSGGNTFVSLEAELKMVSSYISIQRLARERVIKFTTDIPEELLKHEMINLTLQPLVENAILHGFSGYREDGEINISAKVTQGEFQISVEDNGVGMLPEELDSLSLALDIYPPPAGQKNFGLYNVNRRIKNAFGNQYGIRIESAISEYTMVIIRMPA